MNNKTDIDVQYVSPLKKICMTIGELPSSYLETMSYYEMLVWFTEFLKNQVIPTVNNNAEAVQELQTLYEELRTYVNDYFDNLDVQDEINNKLDQMLEDGVLEQIIEQYLISSSLWCFDTVSEMKQASNLIDGSYARTLGYFSLNDGAGALYKITDTQSLTDYQEELDSGLYATLIGDEITITSDLKTGFNDDDDMMSYCFNGNFKTINIKTNVTVTSSIDIPSNTTINNDAILTGNMSRVFSVSNKENIKIYGGEIKTVNEEATSADSYQPILISNCENVEIKNCIIRTQSSDGLYIGVGYSESVFDKRTQNILVESCKFINCARNGIVINAGDNILVNNCYFDTINTYLPGHAIDIEYEYRNTSTELYTRNLNITNCYAVNCNTLINIYPSEKMADKSDVNVSNCICDGTRIIVHGPSDGSTTESMLASFNNITFKNMSTVYNIRIASFKAPSYLTFSNIFIDDFLGTQNTNTEYGDIFIDSQNNDINNILIDNLSYIGSLTRNQTFRFKNYTTVKMKVYNTAIQDNYSKFLPFDVKFINCVGTINSNTKGNNDWFKVMELPDYCKLDFNVLSSVWLNIQLLTDDSTNSLVVSKGVGNTYISKARIVLQNEKKYLEFYTTRQYSLPIIYDVKTIPNGIDKLASTAVQDDVLVEVNVTTV